MSGVLSAFVVYGCLSVAGPDECMARTLEACQTLAVTFAAKRKLARPPLCELRWSGF